MNIEVIKKAEPPKPDYEAMLLRERIVNFYADRNDVKHILIDRIKDYNVETLRSFMKQQGIPEA